MAAVCASKGASASSNPRRLADGGFEELVRGVGRDGRALQAGRGPGAVPPEPRHRARRLLPCRHLYRTAEFFLHGDPTDPRIVATWRKSRQAFVTAARLDTRTHFEVLWIPYKHTRLPAYFYAAKTGWVYHPVKRPLLIIQTGFDGCQEELHPYAMAAVERGYNVLTFEGPGQGEVIRVQKLPFRADWEHVVRPVLRYAMTRRDVDRDRIGLWGISLGGYLAPRAAGLHSIALPPSSQTPASTTSARGSLLAHLRRGRGGQA